MFFYFAEPNQIKIDILKLNIKWDLKKTVYNPLLLGYISILPWFKE